MLRSEIFPIFNRASKSIDKFTEINSGFLLRRKKTEKKKKKLTFLELYHAPSTVLGIYAEFS